mmetsp:Transcript_65003/g.153629  ORF Transcript_65003/g.153629 Transcript_65003/m.153629 type:complete len:588 (+) Transcript_65003:41-1804(+)
MSTMKKLQGEIDTCLKRVQEGMAYFDEIWDKVHSASTPAQKEKFEGELKREIKKLQRLRESIKSWIANDQVKDKQPLIDARKAIENDMERFKYCEKETKTKAYSKEGLAQQPKLGSLEQKKVESREWIDSCIEQLETQVDATESELESLRSKRKGNKKTEKEEGLNHSVTRHRFHIRNLEHTLRLLENDQVSPEQVAALKDDIDYYVESNQDPDFVENDDVYEQLGLDDLAAGIDEIDMPMAATRKKGAAVEEDSGRKKKEEKKKEEVPKAATAAAVVSAPAPAAAAPSPAKPAPVPAPAPIPAPAAAQPVGRGQPAVQPRPGVPAQPPGQQPLRPGQPATVDHKKQPQQPASQQLPHQPLPGVVAGRGVPPAVASKPVAGPGVAGMGRGRGDPAQGAVDPRMMGLSQQQHQQMMMQRYMQQGGQPGIQGGSVGVPGKSEDDQVPEAPDTLGEGVAGTEDAQEALRLLGTSLRQLPDAVETDRPRPPFDNPALFERLDPDTLFFIFYYQPGTYQQFLAARELKKHGWRFHKKYLTWFQRHEEPEQTSTEFEQGTYVYFDYETGWCQRIKSEFMFEYVFLEDELPAPS